VSALSPGTGASAPEEGRYGTDTAPWPAELRVFRSEGRIEIDFTDGTNVALPAEYLRVESPSAEVQGHGGAATRKTVAGRRLVKITAVEPVGHYAIRIIFDDGHDSGLYSWSYLRELADSHTERWAAYLAALRQHGQSRDP
jgi:DUF971 family protein